jgi:excinuclease ABC subunit A
MTELNDHLKLLFARAGQLFDKATALPVRHDNPETIRADLQQRAAAAGDPRLVLTFPVELPADTSAEQQAQWLSASGFTRVQSERVDGTKKILDVVADRFRIAGTEKVRAMEAIETALKRGSGRLTVFAGDQSDGAEPTVWRWSTGLHCPESDLRYADPQPALFSFNSAFGACDSCRGFGRVIGVDMGLVIPDAKRTLRNGAIKPMQTPAWKDCQDDLVKYAGEAGIPRDTSWLQLTEAQRQRPGPRGEQVQVEALDVGAFAAHHQQPLAGGECGTEVDGGRRLPNSSLLIGHSDDFAHRSSMFHVEHTVIRDPWLAVRDQCFT